MNHEQRILALTRLQAQVKKALDAERSAWADGKEIGTRMPASFSAGRLGTISLEEKTGEFVLVDEAALLKWALANNQNLVDFEPRISSATKTVLKKNPVTSDGEIIPGFELAEPVAKVVVRSDLKGDPDAVIADAMRSGELVLSELLEIEQ